mmetsp:Transcript_3723/g.7957  ORF Transcript_3723/g.7957 Transcript_3723/m.7957 type:complete len:89 (-) Transcript_3723:32-298(-)
MGNAQRTTERRKRILLMCLMDQYRHILSQCRIKLFKRKMMASQSVGNIRKSEMKVINPKSDAGCKPPPLEVSKLVVGFETTHSLRSSW